MQLPAAVLAQSKKSDELIKRINGKPQEGQGTTPQQDGTPEPNRDTLPPASQQVPPEGQQPPQEPDPKESEETYKQRYLTLKGKFDAQVPRLQQDLRSLQEKASAIEAENARLKTAAEQSQQSKTPGEDPTGLNKADFEEYGPEFGALVDEIQRLKNDNTQLQTQLADLSGSVSQDAYTHYMDQVKDHVQRAGHDFDTLNGDPAFLNWLRQVPDGEAEPRFSKLKRAESFRDLEATKGIFSEYLGQIQSKQQQQVPRQQQVPNLQPDALAPGSDVQPPNSTEKRIWTRAEISKHYQDKVRGAYRGKEDKAAAIEADIHAASAEGRIRA